MKPGQPLPDPEVWFRVLTQSDHRTKEGMVHRQALKTPQGFSPTGVGSTTYELSGRAAAKAGNADDVLREAEARMQKIRDNFAAKGIAVPSKTKFVGIAIVTARAVRGCPSSRTDVVFTPISQVDEAHSDILATAVVSPEAIDAVIRELLDVMKTISPAEIVEHWRINSLGQ